MSYRIRYESEMKKLKINLLEMCGLVTSQINDSVKALLSHDLTLAADVAAKDDTVDEKEHEIEKQCLGLLLREQPVARDFREVLSSLKMITDLERIGDQAEDIARLVLTLEGRDAIEHFGYIARMTEVALRMVKGSVDAFIKEDLRLAEEVVNTDDEMDELFLRAKEQFSESIRKQTDKAEDIINAIMIAKYLERIGDHAVNICEWTRYYEAGER